MKPGAIFDMDGTLLDTERLYQESWEVLAGEFGIEHNPAFPLAVCGSNGDNMVRIIRSYYPEIDAEAFMNACYARVAGLVEHGAPKKPGAEEILRWMHERGVKLAVASSNTHAQIVKNLSRAGLLEYFDAIAGGDEVAHSKPDPDIFQLAAQRLDCAPDDCYVFEDGINGIRAAAAAGCVTVMIPDLTPPDDEIRALCAGVCGSLLEAKQQITDGVL